MNAETYRSLGAAVPPPIVMQWPLGRDMRVELRFIGGPLRTAHINALQRYLATAKDVLAGDENARRADTGAGASEDAP